MSHSQKTSSVFLHRLQDNYPNHVMHTDIHDLSKIYQQILRAKIDWNIVDTANASSTVPPYTDVNTTHVGPNGTRDGTAQNDSLTFDTSQTHSRVKRSAGGSSSCDFPFSGSGLTHSASTEERVANGLHKTGLSIVCVLLVETLLKIFCFGRQFFEHKLEVFDAFVVLMSLIVDLIFLEGLSGYSLKDFVYILAFILPWGVIRVVNSLVVVVRDHEHFRLKLLYTQKKKVDSDNKHLRQEKEKLSDQVDSLRRLCLGEGVDDFRIQQSMTRSSSRPGKGIMGSFASLAMGAIGGGKSNGTSFWNLLNTPKLKRGKSEEWEGKLGVSKLDSQSMRFNERLWTVSGVPEMKKPKKSQSLTQQGTTESDPGTPPTIRGRLKALKRLLKRQETVDSYSSTETIDKNSRFSLDRLSSSDNITPLQSVDIESVTDMETGDEAPQRISLSPYDVINECMEDKLEESSNVGNIGSGGMVQEPSSLTHIIVTTCSTDDCDSLTFSTGGSKNSLKNRTFDGRTMEIAVDIEHSDSEVVPMLHHEPEVSPAVPILSSPSLPSNHKQIGIPYPEADATHNSCSTHVGHLPNLNCGHHSHSYNCISSTTQHNKCDVPHTNNTGKNVMLPVSRNHSMPSTSGETGSHSNIAMQPHPVKACSSHPDMTPSPKTTINPTTPQYLLNSQNVSHYSKGNSLNPSKRTHFPKTAVSMNRSYLPNIDYQTNQIANTGRAIDPTTYTNIDHPPNKSPVSHNTPLADTINSASRIPSSADRSPSPSNNVPETSKRGGTHPPNINCTIGNETLQHTDNKSSPFSNIPSSFNSNILPLDSTKTSQPSGKRASSYLLHTSRTPSPLQNRRTRSPDAEYRNSSSSRSPSVHRSPSPSGFVSIHTSNSDITSGFRPIQIPETHLDCPFFLPKHVTPESPTNLNIQQNSSESPGHPPQNFSDKPGDMQGNSCDSPGQTQQGFSDNPGHMQGNSSDSPGHTQQGFSDGPSYTQKSISDSPVHIQENSSNSPDHNQQNLNDSRGSDRERQGRATSYLVDTQCPDKLALQNRNNSHHYPSRKTQGGNHAFNGPTQLELSDAIKKRISEISQKSLDHFPTTHASDPAIQRRSSMH